MGDAAKPVEDEARAIKRREVEAKVAAARLEQEQRAAKGGALSIDEIIEKLNEVPVFAVQNESQNFVSMKDDDGTVGAETIFWHTNPAEAARHLERMREVSPEVSGLNLGGSTLGTAYALGAGWTGGEIPTPQHAGDSRTTLGGGRRAPMLRHQIVMTLGLPVEMPVFLCPPLQNQLAAPVFLDRVDLAGAWIQSGRTKESFDEKEHLIVMDLRVLVEQMKTDATHWSLIRFIPSSRVMAIVNREKARMAQAIAEGDEPPPLEG